MPTANAVKANEEVLKKIADTTGGKYYLASDAEKLRKMPA